MYSGRLMQQDIIQAPRLGDPQEEKEKFEISARPWPRYWAKYFDIFLFGMIASLGLAFFAPRLFEAGGLFENDYFAGFALLPAALLLESVCYILIGTTPGKWLTGIKMVTWQGERVPLSIAVGRNFHLWLSGLALGIPLIAIVTLSHNYSAVKSGKLTRWDEKYFTRIKGDPPGWRTWLVAALSIGSMVGLNVYGSVNTHTNTASSFLGSVATDDMDRLHEHVAAMRKGLPIKIDEWTVWENVDFEYGNRFSYYYTLPQLDVDPEDVDKNSQVIRNEIGDGALASYCGDESGLGLRKIASSVRYVYYDRSGRLAGIVQFFPSDCPD